MFKKYVFLMNIIAKYVLIISQAMLFLMVIIILTLVISRYVFLYSFPWAEEVSRYLMIWSSLLLVGNLFERREHIKMTFFVDLLPKKLFLLQRIFFDLAFIIYFYFMLKEGYLVAISMNSNMSASLDITMFWPYFAIPFSSLLVILFLLKDLIEDFNIFIQYIKNKTEVTNIK